jgi:single-strand DNA-binding protein
MSGYQQLIVEGFLGNDPERRVLADNSSSYANFSVCVNEKHGEKEKLLWVRVTAWGKLGEACMVNLQKGSHAMVIGKLQADEHGQPGVYKRQDGAAGSSFSMQADVVRFLDSKEKVTDEGSL